MHDVVLLKVMYVISSVNYVVVSADEMTTVDVQHWMHT
jgi:hypothetical protein